MSKYFTALQPSIEEYEDKDKVVIIGKANPVVNMRNAQFKHTLKDNILSIRGDVGGTTYGFDITVNGPIGEPKITPKSDGVEVLLHKLGSFSMSQQAMS